MSKFNMSHALKTSALAAVTVGAFAGSAIAGQPVLSELTAGSDLVFHGVVQDIEYRMSAPTGAEKLSVPFTFITYVVESVLRGEIEGDTVTLQFIGGWDPVSMRYLRSSMAPQFDLGDEDILFVQGNTDSFVPLVNDDRGRFRVINGQVYTETGRAIVETDEGRLQFGHRFNLPEVFTTQVIDGPLLTSGANPDEIVDGESNAITLDQALQRVSNATRGLKLAEGKFVNADPLAPIAGPDMTPAAPPADKAPQPKVNDENEPVGTDEGPVRRRKG